MKQIVIAYHSGYGHTQKQAQAVAEGANTQDTKAQLLAVDTIDDAGWDILKAADAIIFGAPTYMGSVSAQFKTFADASSKVWFELGWKDKIAAGFTNSASINGDKQSSLQYLWTFAMQHGMIWVGTGIPAANTKNAQRNDINYMGSFGGLMAQSPADASVDEGPLPGDLATAKLFGQRIAEITNSVKATS